jgi:hypothetical protein
MSTSLLVALCLSPLLAIFVLGLVAQGRKERRAMSDFAALLDGGTVSRRRATGRWKGVEVTIRFAAKPNHVFLTVVSASRRITPFAAVLLPRPEEQPAQEPPPDAPSWLGRFDRAYQVWGAPPHLLRTLLDEGTTTSLRELQDTEIEVLPHLVNVQRRAVLHETEPVKVLLDAAVRLVFRLDSLHDQFAAFTTADAEQRLAEVDAFMRSFR